MYKRDTDRYGVFVIHEHHSTHLHWDMRLGMDGVLKSWALPKIPPAEAGIKRLAIQTEDHSLDYANFEGVIPEGLYGAGVVKIWDNGKYELITRTQNKIEFILYGQKLKGTYVLLKFAKAGDNQWLFLKKGHKNDIKYQNSKRNHRLHRFSQEKKNQSGVNPASHRGAGLILYKSCGL